MKKLFIKSLALSLWTLGAHASGDSAVAVVPECKQMGQVFTSATLTIRKVLSLFTPEALKAIDAMHDRIKARIDQNKKLIISDIGCYDGFNSYETIKAMIARIRELFGSDFVIEVAYSDLMAEPAEFLQKLLRQPEMLGENVVTSYRSHNVFTALPYQSDITLCSYTTHWLSKEIEAGKQLSSIFPTCFAARSPEKEQADRISAADIHDFYHARQQDTALFAACVHMAKQEDGGEMRCTARNTMTLMDDVFNELYAERKIADSSFYISFAYRTAQQLMDAAILTGSQILSNRDVAMPSVFLEKYGKGELSLFEVGQWTAKEARGWSEGSIQSLVGKDLVEEFYKRLEQKVQTDPLRYASNHRIQFLVTTPR